MAEQLIRNEQVAGSIPVTSSRKRRFFGIVFFIQSEGLICNRPQAYVITQSVYAITAVYYLRIDYIHPYGLITYRLRRITYTAAP